MSSVKFLVSFSLDPSTLLTLVAPSYLESSGPQLSWCSLAAQKLHGIILNFLPASPLSYQNTLILCSIPLVFHTNRKSDLLIHDQVFAVDNDNERRCKSASSRQYLVIAILRDGEASKSYCIDNTLHMELSLLSLYIISCLSFGLSEKVISSEKVLDLAYNNQKKKKVLEWAWKKFLDLFLLLHTLIL